MILVQKLLKTYQQTTPVHWATCLMLHKETGLVLTKCIDDISTYFEARL